MKLFKRSAIAALALLFSISCGEEEESSTNSFDGNWKIDCNTESADPVRQSLSVQNNELTLSSTYFDGTDCTGTATSSFSVTAKLSIGEDNDVGTETDMTFQAMTVTYLTQEEVDSANADQEHGITDWTVGAARTVDFDMTIFTILKINASGELCLGDSQEVDGNTVNEGDTPETRHVELSTPCFAQS